ncbi:MAG: hypothetical protein H0W48_00670 [Methylibium sp.]|nr:hypothetical protein [Methylibium sp.]
MGDHSDDMLDADEHEVGAAATLCQTCGEPYQVVRPGKIQPGCDCDVAVAGASAIAAPDPTSDDAGGATP